MKFEKTDVWNMQNAFRGMRNPLNSWHLSDSYLDVIVSPATEISAMDWSKASTIFVIGPQDMALAQKLIRAGTEHRKFLRQILVSVDITAPLYWWKEFDTYKVGTVANSTSTMHKIMASEFRLDMFEFDDFQKGTLDKDLKDSVIDIWVSILDVLNQLRQGYLDATEEGDSGLAKFYWKELIKLLPSGYLQTRTITMNYENLMSMYYHRRNHKLTEWHQYCDWIQTLPYTQALFGIG